jgi:Tfp pilus assembly protein PilF
MAKRTRPKAAKASRKPFKPAKSSAAHRRPDHRGVTTTPVAAPEPKQLGPERLQLAPAAIDLFQRGMESLQRHQYQQAAASFRSVLERFPDERALLDRTRVYLDLCERELRRKPANPQTAEERLTSATAALNDGDETRAEQLAKSVLTDDPEHDLALYLLAAVEARRGNPESALAKLRQAITISPEVSAQARHDSDFDALHDLPEFHELTETPPTSTPRRPRRGRAER